MACCITMATKEQFTTLNITSLTWSIKIKDQHVIWYYDIVRVYNSVGLHLYTVLELKQNVHGYLLGL